METNKLEILIVEDGFKHMRDAMADFKPLVDAGEATIEFATSYMEAMKKIGGKKYDGVISDIFFPYADFGMCFAEGKPKEFVSQCSQALESIDAIPKRQGFEEVVAAYDMWKDGTGMPPGGRDTHTLPPSGVMVAEHALEYKLPIVFCTDTYHHGEATEPVTVYARKKGIQLIDCTDGRKKWGMALEALTAAIVDSYKISDGKP